MQYAKSVVSLAVVSGFALSSGANILGHGFDGFSGLGIPSPLSVLLLGCGALLATLHRRR